MTSTTKIAMKKAFAFKPKCAFQAPELFCKSCTDVPFAYINVCVVLYVAFQLKANIFNNNALLLLTGYP